MMVKKCFEPGCINEVEYACKCSSPDTLLCGEHIGEHANLPHKAHNLESIFMQPCEGTKEAILEYLTKEDSKCSELRIIIMDSFRQHLSNSEKDLDFARKLDCYSDEINDFFAKISQVSKLLKSEQDPILGLLSLYPQEAIEKVKFMTIANRDCYNGAKLFCIFNQKLESLNRSFFTEICGAYLKNRNMQNSHEMHNKTSKPASIESANVKDSISLIINENSESLKGPKNVNKPIELTLENETSLLNSQISTVSNDLNNKSKETESVLKVIETLRNKTAEILSRPNNPELEIDFRTTCSAIQTSSSLYDPPLMKAYQEYLKAYQQKASLYNVIEGDNNNRTNLIIYNTETETEEVKTLQIPQPLDSDTCITQLPNGKLFCYGNNRHSGITVLIDVNGGVEVLPSGAPWEWSSCIYFNNSVYCFGGNDENYLSQSSRFDLDRNRWIQLNPMPKHDYMCSCIIFNGNILISGYQTRNLLSYSTGIDSFTTIPYEFEEMKIKILINAERLYLIECDNGSIYESEIGSYSNWRWIGKSKMDCDPEQVYCSYNKGGICISTISESSREYYIFNLNQKIIIDVAYYNKHVLLRRVGKKIEALKCNNQNFKLDPYYLDENNVKDIALKYLAENLEIIGWYDEQIKLNSNNSSIYDCKGHAFENLERYQEAIECYDEAIKLFPNYYYFYQKKGNVYENLERYLEAIEFYDEAIKLNPNNANLYNKKGNSFKNLERYLEAIECYDEAIKLNPNNTNFYWAKGLALNELGRYPETVENYDKAIRIIQDNDKFYNGKGNALYALKRYQEAMQCYSEAIKLNPNNPLYFCNRAKLFNNLRQEEAALQDLNRAYNLKQENQEGGVFTKNEWNLSEEEINFINDALGRDRIELLQKMQI
ncbi:unnamed protein product [Blepharisma stoltei]|uniref:Tetratricopeptide repeat protein n=1 Tax=Blepharisma stoltei TaxID=1481888 RepID=A0AAU9ILE0_9CILI|nr:unnamed protein product [Blepharisma stoltei]